MYNLLKNLFRASRCHFPSRSALICSRLRCQIPSASLWSTHTIPPPCTKFVLILLSASQFIFLFYTQSDLQVHPLFSFLSLIFVPSLLPLLHVRWSLNFSAFGFFFKAAIENSAISTGHCPISYTLFVSMIIILRPTSTRNVVHPQVHYHLHCTIQSKSKPSFEEINLIGPFKEHCPTMYPAVLTNITDKIKSLQGISALSFESGIS